MGRGFNSRESDGEGMQSHARTTSNGARRRLLWQTVEAFFIKLARIGGEIRGEARGNLRFGEHRRRISGLGVPSASGYRDWAGFGEAKKLGR